MFEVVSINCFADLHFSRIGSDSLDAARSRGVQDELRELVRQLQPNTARLLRLPQNESVRFSDLQQLSENQSRVVIVLEGEVTLNGPSPAVTLPVGYPLAVDRMAQQNNMQMLSAMDTPALLLTVPIQEFDKFRHQNSSFSSLLAQVIQSVHPTNQMPPEARESIQNIRGQNISTLITLKAMQYINEEGGLLDVLNPERVSFQIQGEIGRGARSISSAEQFWHLVEISSDALHRSNYTLVKDLAIKARQTAQLGIPEGYESAVVGVAFSMFAQLMLLETHNFRAKLDNFTAELFSPEVREEATQKKIGDRLIEIHWLKGELGIHDYSFPQDSNEFRFRLRELIPAVPPTDPKALLKELDTIYESLFKQAGEKQNASLLSIRFDKRPATLSLTAPTGDFLAGNHENQTLLGELAIRLERGEKSAVGGSDYTKMRFPDEVLGSIAEGKTIPIFYDGTQEDGINFARRVFGANQLNPNLLEGCTIVNLQGRYGKFERTLIFFRNGVSVLVVSHTGPSRQLSNAAAMLLYEDSEGTRIPRERIIMAGAIKPAKQRVAEELEQILANEKGRLQASKILGDVVEESSLRNQLVMLLRPSQIPRIFGDTVEVQKYSSEVIGELNLAYLRMSDGRLTRLIVPAVGSAGLYGGAAGDFVKALFESTKLNHLSKHILFSATAGGIGIAPISAGSDHGELVVIPERGITFRSESFRFTNLLSLARLRVADKPNQGVEQAVQEVEQAMWQHRIWSTTSHQAIDVPALETFPLLDQMANNGHSTIDCEAGPIAMALKALGASIKGLTFTPLYVISDYPLANRHDRSKSLAYGGAVHDVSYSRTVDSLLPLFLKLSYLLDLTEAKSGN